MIDDPPPSVAAVFFVDDDAVVLKSLARLLRSAGLAVAAFASRREVLQHVITGQLNKQSAADLGTVEKTIKVHRARVLEKMQVHSVAELVHLAERVGIAAR